MVVKQGLPYKKHEPRSVRKQGQRGITPQRYEVFLNVPNIIGTFFIAKPVFSAVFLLLSQKKALPLHSQIIT